MSFSSLYFLLLFLPAILAVYHAVRGSRLRNLVLVAAGAVFYANGGVAGLAVLGVSIAFNFVVGLAVDALGARRRTATAVLIAGVIGNVALLGYYKYTGLALASANGLLGTTFVAPAIVMPAGVSFFTFQGLSYLIDVHRGKTAARRNPLDIALYMGMFATVMSGPIVRWEAFAEQIADRHERLADVAEGAQRFIIGLAKKAMIAGALGTLASSTFDVAPGTLSTAEAWLGAIGFTGQIYFDFSGYSDMAIGLGRMFGFRFPENFDHPYASRSVSEFWRRWHISLGRWFREYVYVPLGGNRVGILAQIRNILVVWALTGLWHGANWTYAAWGLYYGVLLLVEKFVLGERLERVWAPLRHVGTMLAVILGWVLFRSSTFSGAAEYLRVMFGLAGTGVSAPRAVFYLSQYRFELVAGVLFSMPVVPALRRRLAQALPDSRVRALAVACAPLAMGVLFIVSLSYVVSTTFQPFLYFKF